MEDHIVTEDTIAPDDDVRVDLTAVPDLGSRPDHGERHHGASLAEFRRRVDPRHLVEDGGCGFRVALEVLDDANERDEWVGDLDGDEGHLAFGEKFLGDAPGEDDDSRLAVLEQAKAAIILEERDVRRSGLVRGACSRDNL